MYVWYGTHVYKFVVKKEPIRVNHPHLNVNMLPPPINEISGNCSIMSEEVNLSSFNGNSYKLNGSKTQRELGLLLGADTLTHLVMGPLPVLFWHVVVNFVCKLHFGNWNVLQPIKWTVLNLPNISWSIVIWSSLCFSWVKILITFPYLINGLLYDLFTVHLHIVD